MKINVKMSDKVFGDHPFEDYEISVSTNEKFSLSDQRSLDFDSVPAFWKDVSYQLKDVCLQNDLELFSSSHVIPKGTVIDAEHLNEIRDYFFDIEWKDTEFSELIHELWEEHISSIIKSHATTDSFNIDITFASETHRFYEINVQEATISLPPTVALWLASEILRIYNGNPKKPKAQISEPRRSGRAAEMKIITDNGSE